MWTTCFRNQHSIGWATQLTALHCSDCISGGLPRPISRLRPLRFVTCLIIASAVYLHSLTGAHVINVKEKCCDNCQVISRDIVPTETKIVHQVHELYAGVDIRGNILIYKKTCFPSQKSWTLCMLFTTRWDRRAGLWKPPLILVKVPQTQKLKKIKKNPWNAYKS